MTGAQLCVLCRAHAVDPRWRPFCSERCRNEDLARWVTGGYAVPGEPALDDGLPEDSDES